MKHLITVWTFTLAAAAWTGAPALAQSEPVKPEAQKSAAEDEKTADKYQKLLKPKDQSQNIVFEEKYLVRAMIGSASVVADPPGPGEDFGSQESAMTFQAHISYRAHREFSMGGFIGWANFDKKDFFADDSGKAEEATLVPFGFQATLHLGQFFYLGGTTGFVFEEIGDDSDFDFFFGPHIGFMARTEGGLAWGVEVQGLMTPNSPTDYMMTNVLANVGWWL